MITNKNIFNNFSSILKIKLNSILIIILNYIFIKNLSKKTKLKILLCTIAKEENKYIKEFVDFYRKLKFSKIILYDNNNIMDESLEKIIKKDIKKKFVKLINYRGIDRPQAKALDECYKKYNNNYDWIAFYDIDEFLYIKNVKDINEFLSLNKFNKCQSIIINWKYYGDNNNLFYEKKPLNKRFTIPFYFKNKKLIKSHKYLYSAAKSIVRGKLNLIWAHFPHYFKNTINCRPDGKILKNYFSPPQYTLAYISHYITKSTQEFIERLKRGDVLLKTNNRYIKNRIKNYYFLFNKIINKKLILFKKSFNFKNLNFQFKFSNFSFNIF